MTSFDINAHVRCGGEYSYRWFGYCTTKPEKRAKRTVSVCSEFVLPFDLEECDMAKAKTPSIKDFLQVTFNRDKYPTKLEAAKALGYGGNSPVMSYNQRLNVLIDKLPKVPWNMVPEWKDARKTTELGDEELSSILSDLGFALAGKEIDTESSNDSDEVVLEDEQLEV